MNWISPTGLKPWAAMPTHSPLIKSSASGVSITRSGPKRCCRATVARNTPPLTPTSCPSTTTLGSSSRARARARLTASTSVISGIGCPHLLALGHADAGQHGIEMVEHRLRRTQSGCQITLDRRLDALLALGGERFLLRLAPGVLADQVGAHPGDRLLLPARLNLLGRAITRCIIRSRVVGKPIRQRLDQARAV